MFEDSTLETLRSIHHDAMASADRARRLIAELNAADGIEDLR